jgi:hypothetical protein
VTYDCANGESVSVRFPTGNGNAVLTRHGQTIELRWRASSQGFIFSDGPNTIRGKDAEMMLEIGSEVPVSCQSK